MSPVGWQVTLCDPIWHVNSSSGVATSVSELLYPCYLLTFILNETLRRAQRRANSRNDATCWRSVTYCWRSVSQDWINPRPSTAYSETACTRLTCTAPVHRCIGRTQQFTRAWHGSC